MQQETSTLALPLLQPSQAQKHVTHNEALRILDLLTQLRVRAFEAETPPTDPQPGAAYALGNAPTGTWSGQALSLAYWDGNSWLFRAPQTGWRAWGETESELRVWDGSTWRLALGAPESLSRLGISTSADTTNRFALRSPASLFTHDGTDHQLKVNKASDGDTASLLFQSNWSGRAEMGLMGDADFTIKVSPDGTDWTTALQLDRNTGQISGAAIQSAADDVTAGRLMRADYGYGPGNLLGTVGLSGSIPNGAVIERGGNSNGQYVRFADGTQICHREIPSQNVSATSQLNGFHRSDIQAYDLPRDFFAPPACSISRSTPGGYGLISEIGYTNTDGWRVRFMAPASFSNTSSGILTLMAVGRWA